MDAYSVLGVRKNASRTEIELAFKGRRSQYHPDRYTSEGAETIAWATSMMQQVNQAYALLSDPAYQPDDSPTAQGSERPQGNRNRQDNTQRSDSVPARDAASILFKPEWDWDYMEKIFAKPNIPKSKLRGAIDSYAPEVKPGHVLILVDDTVFGGAKEGILVTADAIYAKQKFEAPKRIPFTRITKVEPLSHSRIGVNGNEFFKCNIVEHLEMLTFASRLGQVFQAANHAPEANGDEGSQLDENNSDEDETSASEPEEGVIKDFQRDLLRVRSANESEEQKALFDLYDWVLRATSTFGSSLDNEESELDDEERFVLSSDVVRFELFPFVISYAFNGMLPKIGENQAKEVISFVVDEVITEVIIRKEGLDSLRRLPGPEKAKKLLAQSRLLKLFRDRLVEYRESLTSDGDVSSAFLENLQNPMIGKLYDDRSREVVQTMIADVVESVLDDETTDEALHQVGRCVDFAIQKYIGAMYE